MSSQRSLIQSLTNPVRGRVLQSMRTPIRPHSDRSQSPRRRPPTSPGRDDFDRLFGTNPAASSTLPEPRSGSLAIDSTLRPMTQEDMALFEDLAIAAGLDEVHRTYGRQQAEIYGSTNQRIALSVDQARNQLDNARLHKKMDALSNRLDQLNQALERQHSSEASVSETLDVIKGLLERTNLPSVTSSPSRTLSSPWTCSPELHEFINELSTKLIVTPDLESYTALEMDAIWLAHSLFSTIKREILKKKSLAWQQEHLPGVAAGVSDGIGTRLFHTQIKNACKHAREKLHILLLSGIYDSQSGDVLGTPVPTIKTLWHRIANKFRVAGDHLDADSLWAHTGKPTRARIAYLRREAISIFQVGRGSSSIWATTDARLNKMRGMDEDFTVMFYQIVYNQDIEIFNGQNIFTDLKENYQFQLPSDQVVQEGLTQEQVPVDPHLV